MDTDISSNVTHDVSAHMLHTEFVKRVVIKIKELKDLVCKSRILYEEDRIGSENVIAMLRRSTLRTEYGFPEPPTPISWNKPEHFIGEENTEAHKDHYMKLQQVESYLNIVFQSETEFEYGRCSEHFEEKQRKFRDLLQEIRHFLQNSSVNLEVEDNIDAKSEGTLKNLKSISNRIQRFCRDYLILKDTETFCEELVRACSCFEDEEVHV